MVEIAKTNHTVKHSEVGVAKSIRTQIQSKVKIRHLESHNSILGVLRYCFTLIGLRAEHMPDDVQRMVLIEFIKKNLANYTPEEIKIAFEMAIRGDFEVDLNHYGNFSPLYLQSVFNAYVSHRNKIALEIEREKDRVQNSESPEEVEKKKIEFLKESVGIYNSSKDSFSGTKYHANVIYELLKPHFTTKELIQFKKEEGELLSELKKQFEERKKYGQQVIGELATTSFTTSEWKRRTALRTANEAISRNIKIDTDDL